MTTIRIDTGVGYCKLDYQQYQSDFASSFSIFYFTAPESYTTDPLPFTASEWNSATELLTGLPSFANVDTSSTWYSVGFYGKDFDASSREIQAALFLVCKYATILAEA